MSKPKVREPSIAQIKQSATTGVIDVDFEPSRGSRGGNLTLTLLTTVGVREAKVAGQAQVIIKALTMVPGHSATISELCDAKVGELSLMEKAGHYGVQTPEKIVRHYTRGENYKRLERFIELS
jgi:hypothetical protein